MCYRRLPPMCRCDFSKKNSFVLALTKYFTTFVSDRQHYDMTQFSFAYFFYYYFFSEKQYGIVCR